jgi:hypothetical protein
MKICLVTVIFFFMNCFAQDVKTQVEGLIKEDQQLCVSQILQTFNVNIDTPQYSNLAQTIFKNLCVTIDKNKIKVLTNGVEISGQAQYNSQSISASLRILKSNSSYDLELMATVPKLSLSAINASLQALDVTELENVTIFYSNTSLKDTFNMIPVKKGLTVEAGLKSTGFLTQALGTGFNELASQVRLRIFVPAGAKSMQDVKTQLVPVDGKTITLHLKDLPGLSKIPQDNAYIKSFLSDTCLKAETVNFDVKKVDGKNKISGSLAGEAEVVGAKTKVELHFQDGDYIAAVKIKSLDDLLKNMPGLNVVGDQLKQLFTFEELLFVVSNTSGLIQLKTTEEKPEQTQTMDDEFADFDDEELMALFGEEFIEETESGEEEQTGMQVEPGWSITGKVKASGIIADTLSKTNLKGAYISMHMPKKSDTVQKQTLKDIQIKLEPLVKTDEGLCLGSFLQGVLAKFGIDALVAPVKDILDFVCFGTEIGVVMTPEMKPELFIQGPLKKKPNMTSMVKIGPAPEGSKSKFSVAFGLKGSDLKVSDIIPLKELDIFELENPLILMTTKEDASVFDIQNGAIDENAPGAIHHLQKGLTVEAGLKSTGFLTQALGTGFNELASQVRLRIFVPAGAKSMQDVKTKLIPVDGKPLNICLKDLPGLSKIPQDNAYIKSLLSNTCLKAETVNFDVKKVDGKNNISGSLAGEAEVAGAKTKVELHFQDGDCIAAVKIKSLNDLLKNMPVLNAVGDQLKQLFTFEELLFVFSNTSGLIQLKTTEEKPEQTQTMDDEFADFDEEELMALFGEEFVEETAAGEEEQTGMQVEPGWSITGKVKASGIIADTLSKTNLKGAYISMHMPKKSDADQKQTLKDIQIKLEPLVKTDEGLCLGSFLQGVLAKFGIDALVAPVKDILDFVCFGTEIGITFNADMKPQLFIQGPLKKKPAMTSMVKIEPTPEGSSSKFYITFGLKGGTLKMSDILPLDQLDIFELENPIILMTTKPDASVFDIEEGVLNEDAPGAIHHLEKGLTVEAGLKSTGFLTQALGSGFNKLASQVRLRVFVPAGAKSMQDVKTKLIPVDGKPLNICLKDLPGLSKIPQDNAYIKSLLSKTCLKATAFDFDVQQVGDKKKVSVSLAGEATVIGAQTQVELHFQDGKYIAAVKVKSIDDLLKNIPGLNIIGDQLKSFFTFEQLLFVIANTSGKIQLQISKDPKKPGLEKLKAEFGLPIPTAQKVPETGMIVKPGITVGGKVESEGVIKTIFSAMKIVGAYVSITKPKVEKTTVPQVNVNTQGIDASMNGYLVKIDPITADGSLDLGNILLGFFDKFGFGSFLSPFKKLLSTFSFGIGFDLGIDFRLGKPLFFINGPFKLNPSLLGMLKINLPLKGFSLDGVDFSFGLKGPSFKLTDFIPLDILKGLGLDLFSLQNLMSALTNGINMSIFDIQNGLLNINAPGALLNLPKGFTIDAQLLSGGFLTQTLGFLIDDILNSVRFRIEVPFGATSLKDIKLSLNLLKKQKFCLNKLPGLSGMGDVPLLKDVFNSCLEVDSLDLNPISNDKYEFAVDGKAKLAGQDAAVQLRLMIDLKTKKKTYIVGVKPLGKLGVEQIAPGLSLVDKIATIENPVIVYAEDDYEGKIFSFPRVNKGLNIITDFKAKGFIGDVFKNLGLEKIKAMMKITKNDQGKIRPAIILFLEGEADGVSMLGALEKIIQGLDIDVAESLQSVIEMIQFGTTIGILFDEKDEPVLFFDGKLIKNTGVEAMVKFTKFDEKGSILSKHLGDIAGAASVVDEQRNIGYKVVGAIRTGEIRLGDISKDLSFLDSQIKINDPVIAFTNGDGASIYDINVSDMAIKVMKGQSIENLNMGITILGRAEFPPGSYLYMILSKFGLDTAGIRVEIPVLAKDSKQVEFKFETDSGSKSEKFCLSSLKGVIPVGLVPSVEVLSKVFGGSDICLQKRNLGMQPVETGLDFIFNGYFIVKDKPQDMSIVFNIKQKKSEGDSGPEVILTTQLSGDLDLGMFNDKLKGQVVLKQPRFIISSQETEADVLGIGEIQKGFSIRSKVHFGGYIGKALDMFQLNDMYATVRIPPDPTDLDGYIIEASQAFDKAQKPVGDDLQVLGFDYIFKGGIPPTFALNLNTLFRIPGGSSQPISLTFTTAVSGPDFTLAGTAKCHEGACPVLSLAKFFPAELSATKDIPLAALIHIVGGGILGIGGSGVADLFGQKAQISFDIDPVHINKSGIKGKVSKLCATDFSKIYEVLGNVSSDFANIFSKIPGFFCITDVSFSVAKDKVTIAGVVIDPGIVLKGNFACDIKALPMTGKIDLSIIPPSLSNLITKLQQIGVHGVAKLDPVKWGDFMSITDVSGKGGPTLEIDATLKKQGVKMSGLVKIAYILNAVADVVFGLDGISINISQSIAGIQLDRKVKIPFKNPADGSASCVLSQGLVKAVTKSLEGLVKDATDVLNKTVGGAQQALLGSCDTVLKTLHPLLNVSCTDCLKNLGPTGFVEAAIDSLNKYAKKILDSLDIKSARFDIDFGSIMAKKMPSLIIKYVFADSADKTLTIGNFDITKPQMVVEQLVMGIWKEFAPGQLVSLVTGNAGEVAKSITGALKDQKLECTVSSQFGGADASLKVSFQPSDPQSTQATGTISNLCVDNLIAAANNIGVGIPLVKFPSIGCIKDAEVTISAGSLASIQGTAGLLGANVQLKGSVSKDGVQLNGVLDKDISLGLVKLSGHKGSGCSCGITLNKSLQQIMLDGNIEIGKIVNSDGYLAIRMDEIIIDSTTSIFGLNAKFKASAPLGSPEDISATLTIQQDLAQNIKDAMVESLNETKNKATAGLDKVNSLFSKIKSKCGPLGSVCDSAMGSAKKIVNSAKDAVNVVTSLVDTFAQLPLSIKSIVIKTKFADIQSKGSVTVIFNTGGSDKSMTVDVSLSDMKVFVQDVALAIINNSFKSPFENAKNLAAGFDHLEKKLLDILSNIGDLFKNLMGAAVKEVGKLAGSALNVATDVTATMGNMAGDTAAVMSDISSSMTSLDGIGNLASVDVSKALGEAEDAVKAATQAAKLATEAAGAALDAAKQAVTQAAKAAQQAAKKAIKAAKDAAKKLNPSHW